MDVATNANNHIIVSGIHAPGNWSARTLHPGGAVQSRDGQLLARTRRALEEYRLQNDRIENETIIDIIDPARRTVVSRTRFPGTLQLLNGATAYRIVESSNGDVVVEVLSLAERQ
jgi:hypothetical protein